MKNGVAQVSLDILIKAALTDQPYNQHRLGREARLYARRLSNSYASDFPEDLHDEVFGQAFVELFSVGAAGLVDRSGKALFRRAVLSAIRVVRSDYTAPGRRTRRSTKEILAPIAPEDVGRIASKLAIDSCTVTDDMGRPVVDFDRFSDPKALALQHNIEDRVDVERILRHAPVEVAAALRQLHLNDEPLVAVSASLDMTRFALNRRISAFCSIWRSAA